MTPINRSKELQNLDPILHALAMRAGWNKKEPSLWAEPRTAFRPAHWKWSDAHRHLAHAGDLISTELAERRNLFLVNPIEGNYYATLRTLVSAYQMIKPGERARSHRHSPNALRLILVAEDDVYTVVDGERIDMQINDVVLTPGGGWHGHANDGKTDSYWLDFLDVPMVQLLEPMFMDWWPEGFQEPTAANRSGDMIFRWAEVREQLDQLLSAPDAAGVARLVLDVPSMPTLELAMSAINATVRSSQRRATENQIVAIVAGEGETTIGEQTFQWSRGDVLAIPAWTFHHHAACSDAVLFSVSDAQMQKRLGFFRESSPISADSGAQAHDK
ncbi:MAG: cupin domain-containing protein [Pseudomonadota bacterium]